MADVTLKIDGIQVTVPEGTNVVDAARQAGVDIPVFCYHPRMKAVGMCRMCLVAVGMPRVDRETGQCMLDEQLKPVITMMPKLQTACTTQVGDGMVVHTKTKDVLAAQRGILEFLLTSHPLDCPVCDKGGECPLQNLTMEWGPSVSRFEYVEKAHFEKPVPLGDLIFLDRERCILCSRCIRFQDEIADDPVLGTDNRGRSWQIVSKSKPPFDSKFSGNTTDICPVGALTTADFRFRARVWELQSVPSLCIHCSVGCNVTLDMRHDEIKRVMPRENAFVNDIWICDKGRFGQRFVESGERLTRPLIRVGNEHVPSSWSDALTVVVEKLTAIKKKSGGEALAGLAGEHLSNEDVYLFQRLFRDVLESHNLDHRVGAPGDLFDDNLGVSFGVSSGTNLMSLGKGTTVLVIGADPEEEAPIYMQRLRGIALRGGDLVVVNARPTKLDRSAKKTILHPPGTASQVIRALLSVVLEEVGTQYLPPRTSGLAELRAALSPVGSVARMVGLEEDDLRAVAGSFVQAKHSIIVYGADALTIGPSLTHDLANLMLISGKAGKVNSGLLALLPKGNSRGVLDMGVRSDYGPGYALLAASAQAGKSTEGNEQQRGLNARQMWNAVVEGRIRGMYIMGLDPARIYPSIVGALEKLDFLVVQDMFLTPTARLADVVLPSASFAEREGTYTNAERRVQRARQARAAPGLCMPDWAIVQRVAHGLVETLGMQDKGRPSRAERRAAKAKHAEGQKVSDSQQASWGYVDVRDVASEIAEKVPGYAGITYSALDKTGTIGSWGRQVNEALFYDGTSYENTEGVGIQYPSVVEKSNQGFSMKPRSGESLSTDKRYPFVLLVQRLLYDNDPLLHDSLLQSHVSASYVGINPEDAHALGIKKGTIVQVASVAGTLELAARVMKDVPQGAVLVPYDLPEASAATLQTGPYTRVTVQKVEG